jgi:hypothetical protein
MCLELAPVVRRAIPKLPDWIAHADGETAAAARLAYKDCVAIAEDSGPCFFEMLAAQLPQPWMVLRIISAVMDRPSERYLAESEMVSFGQRVLDEIEGRLKAISNLDLDGGAAAAKAAAGEVELVTLQISEMETFIDLSREHGWGHEIGNCKKALAGIVEGHLRSLEKAVATALPTQQERISRLRHERPKLNLMPDPIAVRRALMLLAFAYETRTSANYGGFVAARTKVVERLGEQLDNYVAEVVDHIRTGDVEDDSVAYAFLEVAADMARLLRDEKAAELVRRRAAAVRNETSARPPRVCAS